VGFEIDYLALAPELVIVVAILGVLVLDLLLPRPLKYITAVVAVLGVSMAAIPLLVMAIDGTTRAMFDGSFTVDTFALVLKAIFVISAYLVLLLSVSYIERDRFYQGEYYFLIL
jgi:NADH-quinone oxidoreductase subunit N